MTENNPVEKNNDLVEGPPRVSFATFLLKILAGSVGGSGGAVVLIIIFFLASGIIAPVSGAEGEAGTSPIFTFVLMMMVFLASTVGNILSIWLLSLAESDRYKRVSSAIYQVFILSIIIFLFMVPVYFITASTIDLTAYAVGLHIILSAQVSALILEIVSNYKYSLVGLYGVTFAVLASTGLLMALSRLTPSPQILLFIALPVVWGAIGFVSSLVSSFYGWLARTYDKDFLSTQTLYGQDYGKEVEDTIEEDPKTKDEAGADFLRHN
jgi:hypothetical protein